MSEYPIPHIGQWIQAIVPELAGNNQLPQSFSGFVSGVDEYQHHFEVQLMHWTGSPQRLHFHKGTDPIFPSQKGWEFYCRKATVTFSDGPSAMPQKNPEGLIPEVRQVVRFREGCQEIDVVLLNRIRNVDSTGKTIDYWFPIFLPEVPSGTAYLQFDPNGNRWRCLRAIAGRDSKLVDVKVSIIG